MTVLMAVDGVLRQAGGGPLHDGFLLYQALSGDHLLILAVDGPTREADNWLRVHGLQLHSQVIGDEVSYGDDDLRARQIAVVRSKGRLDLLVEPDPDRVAAAVRQGVTSLLFAHPRYSRPEFSPDAPKRKRRSWQSIKDELNRQQNIVPPKTEE